MREEPEYNSSGVKTLRQVVMSVLNDLESYTTEKYDRLLNIVIEGFTELRMYDLRSVDVAYLTPNSANIVNLPSDFIDYSKIGMVLNGRVVNLGLNNSIALDRAQQCGQPIHIFNQVPFPTTLGGYYYADHWFGGRHVGGLYGLGGGFRTAYYRVDTERRQIQLQGDVPRKEIVLEYISSGVKPGTVVPMQAFQPLKKWGHWQNIEYDDTVSSGEKERKKQQWEEAEYKLRDFEYAKTLSEYLDGFYSTTGQYPKR